MTVTENTLRRNIAPCAICHDRLDITALGVCQHVSGWAENRTDGGTHALINREPHQRWAHKVCLQQARHRPDQATLAL